ncbi:MAG: thiamine pyrophosphate-binding protein [Nocardioidaceae bacterium]
MQDTDKAATTPSDGKSDDREGPGEGASARPRPATGADLLVESLIAAGVTIVFGLPGDTGVDLYDALYNSSSRLRHVLARDERHAAFMADGYARVTGSVGVVEVSSGGGSTYVVGGLGEAYAASVPILLITSDIHSASRNTGALTEIDQLALYSAVTKWAARADSAQQIPALVEEALTQATEGRPAPVAVVVPEDVFAQQIGQDQAVTLPPAGLLQVPRTRPSADPSHVRAAARMLSAARHPVIVAGSGAHHSEAGEVLAAVATHAALPVATTIQGKGVIADTNPFSLGVVGANGGAEANTYVRDADAVLLIGTRANATDTNGWTAPPRTGVPVAQIDIAADRAGRNFPDAIPLVGDARAVLEQLHVALPAADDARQRSLAGEASAVLHARRGDESTEQPTGDRLDAQRVVQTAQQAVPSDCLIVADPGTPTPYVAAHWRIDRIGRTVVTPRGHGPMGYAIPAAIGVSLAYPDRPVLALTADGGFAMACGELETVHRLDLPILYVQLTNFSLGWIKMLQHLYAGDRYFGVDPGPIDAVAVAQACGLSATHANGYDELAEAIGTHLAAGKPAYIDVTVRHLIDNVPPVAPWHAALAGGAPRPTY